MTCRRVGDQIRTEWLKEGRGDKREKEGEKNDGGKKMM